MRRANADGRIRTCNRRFRRPVLYPIELHPLGEGPNIAKKGSNGLFFIHSARQYSLVLNACRKHPKLHLCRVRMASGTSSWHCSKCTKHSKAVMSPSRYESSKMCLQAQVIPGPKQHRRRFHCSRACSELSSSTAHSEARQVRESCKSGSWWCVLSPVKPADLPHRVDHQLASRSTVNHWSTNLAKVTNRMLAFYRTAFASPLHPACFHTSSR